MFIAHSQGVAIQTCKLDEFGVKIGFSEGIDTCFLCMEIKGPTLGADVGTWIAFEDCRVYL